MLANGILFVKTKNQHILSKSHHSRFVNLITNTHLSFKLKLKENSGKIEINESKIKKEGSKTIEFYKKSRAV